MRARVTRSGVAVVWATLTLGAATGGEGATTTTATTTATTTTPTLTTAVTTTATTFVSARARLREALAAKAAARLVPKQIGDLLAPIAGGPRDTDEARDVAARASFALGELYEEGHIYDEALAHYRDVLAIDAGNYYAATARARIDALAKFDGNYRLLALLDGVRQDPARASDALSLSWLEGIVGTWSPSTVKDEAWLFLAVAWGGRMGQPRRAVAPALALAHRQGADPGLRASAFAVAYDALVTLGELDRARATIGDDPAAPAPLRARIARDFKRRSLHRASARTAEIGAVAAVVAVCASVVRGRWRLMIALWGKPHALAAIVVGALAAWRIGEAWEGSQGAHFLAFGGAMLAVHLLVGAMRGAIGDRALPVRLVGAAIAASSVVASAYLILERGELNGVPILSGFGL